MAEAAIVMPLFFAVLLGSIRILLICYQGIRLQYEVSETMRMTFTLNNAARGGKTWGDYFPATLWSRTRNSGLSLRFTGNPISINQSDISLSYLKSGSVDPIGGWPGADAVPGETFSVTVRTVEPLLPSGLVGNTSALSIALRAKAVAVIHRTQGE